MVDVFRRKLSVPPDHITEAIALHDVPWDRLQLGAAEVIQLHAAVFVERYFDVAQFMVQQCQLVFVAAAFPVIFIDDQLSVELLGQSILEGDDFDLGISRIAAV